jgi:integrase
LTRRWQTVGLPEEARPVTGVADPYTWYQLFPRQPFRTYPHPGYLPPIRLHDLRHGAATVAHAAGTRQKVISEMLRHSTYKFTADVYTTVVMEVAQEAAEATARLVPAVSRLTAWLALR